MLNMMGFGKKLHIYYVQDKYGRSYQITAEDEENARREVVKQQHPLLYGLYGGGDLKVRRKN